jgi:ribosomal subunit interface protein
MQVPLRITVRDMPMTESIDAAVRKHAGRLERFHDRITSCHVTIDKPHQHRHKGEVFRVCVDVVIPHGHVVVSHEPGQDHAHEDVYVALRDAFAAASRRLDQRGERHAR